MSSSGRQLSRSVSLFAGGTLISRVVGLVRDVVLTSTIPKAASDTFFFAFRLPNMFRDILGEGAVNSAFVPVFTEYKEKLTDTEYRQLVGAALSAMLLILGGLTLAGVLCIPYVVPKLMVFLGYFSGSEQKSSVDIAAALPVMQWTFPYLFMIGVTVFAFAPLFIARDYATPGWSPVLLNLALIATCLGFRGYFANPAWAPVIGIWLGGIAQFVVVYVALWRKVGPIWPNFKLRHPGVKQSFWLLGPVIIGQGAGEINKFVDGVFAYSLPEGTVTILYCANRLVQLPLSVFGIAVASVVLPAISQAIARGDGEEAKRTIAHGLAKSLFLITPAMMGLLCLAQPIVQTIFERGAFGPEMTLDTASALRYYGAGLVVFAALRVGVQGFYARQNTKTPVIVASGCMLLNIVLCFLLVGPMGFRGLALATTIAFGLNGLLIWVLLRRDYGAILKWDDLSEIIRITVASILCGVLAWAVWHGLAQHLPMDRQLIQILVLGVAITAGAASYVMASYLLKIRELQEFMGLIRRK